MTSHVDCAIPTRYLGIQFRSRLEARWAAFFSLVGWRWRYEPIDLAGYIPDFIVNHPSTDWLMRPGIPGSSLECSRVVEVKSVMDRDLLTEHASKIERSGWDGDVSIVGATLWEHSHDGHGIELGVERVVDGLRVGWWAWVMVPRRIALSAWRQAGNHVQWKSPNGAASS